MRNFVLVALSLVVSGSVAMAQSKIDTKWHCSKATTENKLDVGDMKEKTGQYTEFHDQWKATFNFHGYYNATMDNGDKVNYTYGGSNSTDTTKPVANKWKIVGGTGKHKGIKGSGACSGKVAADGSSDIECTGTYSMGMAKMDKMK